MATPTAIVAYLALFAGIGFLFLFVNLLVGRLVRPKDPHAEKLEIYECGEPTIGSGFLQFDLRFYVVALVFLVFDVEVAFLFPLATVHGKAAQLADERLPVAVSSDTGQVALTDNAQRLYRELGVAPQIAADTVNPADADAAIRAEARSLSTATLWAIVVFFVILLVGFAYEWKTGAYDWVRVIRQERYEQIDRAPSTEVLEQQPVMSG